MIAIVVVTIMVLTWRIYVVASSASSRMRHVEIVKRIYAVEPYTIILLHTTF